MAVQTILDRVHSESGRLLFEPAWYVWQHILIASMMKDTANINPTGI
jgi:hypothetical protein